MVKKYFISSTVNGREVFLSKEFVKYEECYGGNYACLCFDFDYAYKTSNLAELANFYKDYKEAGSDPFYSQEAYNELIKNAIVEYTITEKHCNADVLLDFVKFGREFKENNPNGCPNSWPPESEKDD